ncbi:hypothetical protein [Haloarchaeobius sp. HME9146]|uniref:hypothetical protein n=1 Tax=Haloarchaeobius sp. HME9146 TaxID=2978732 RepID=UPI0021C07E74|nr:hypothetical protein [Haloarchaeobius sp. HME9146]MCT9094719.1 hypothetical protein [Haloarchaeobius sp. HME9146]
MGVITTIKEMLQASTQSTNRGTTTEQSKGAYWCDDCSERLLDTAVEGDEAPECPSCGEEMRFERSPGSTGCAC